jgi:pimeloyl-ACP methyl ester carboxylesterase
MHFTTKTHNFCDNLMMQCSGTVPAKVLLQLATAFREGGLRNRAGTFFFKEHLRKIKVPVLALAGDEDLICPPEAVLGMATSFIFNLSLRNVQEL